MAGKLAMGGEGNFRLYKQQVAAERKTDCASIKLPNHQQTSSSLLRPAPTLSISAVQLGQMTICGALICV